MRTRPSTHARVLVGGVGLLVVLTGCSGLVAGSGEGSAGPSAVATTPAEPVAAEGTTAVAAALLFVTDQKDGDSFDASDGQEYRLGLINTPERDEPCGTEATAFTRDFLAGGFTARVYAEDGYGRQVAEVLDADGTSLNVALAASGLGNDRYLAEFRHENPDLADRIVQALRSAPPPRCGGSAPRSFAGAAPRSAPRSAGGEACAPGYSPCLPVVADLNCPDVGGPVTVTGADPYRLDRDGDGIACD